MTDGQSLLTLFALLFLAECLRLVPAGVRLLIVSGSHGALRRAFAPLDFAGRRLLVLPVLPPLPVHVVTQPWQLLPCENGLEVLDENGRPEALIMWANVKPVADGRVLRLGEGQRVLFHHAELASAMAEKLHAWATMKAEARERDFEKHARSTLDAKALSAHLAESASLTRWLRGLATVISMLCFGLLPVVYRWLGDSLEILWAAGLLWVTMVCQAVVFWRVAARLQGVQVAHRFWKTLAMFLLPQFALRASDHILEARVLAAHPLAAWPSLKEEDRLKLARHFWKAACHSSAASTELQQRLLRAFWKQHEFDDEKLEEVPERQPGSAAYCPRCSAQFRDATMLCKDCGGVALKPF